MAELNPKTDSTKKVIHLMVTPLCNRNCKYCCNNQYNINDIPYVTDEELREAEVLCLTGGEPFLFTNPCRIARYYKRRYSNIKRVYVYTNAKELYYWLADYNFIRNIDGLNVSIKNKDDLYFFKELVRNYQNQICVDDYMSNRVYIFDSLIPDDLGIFEPIIREWQEDFKPAPDSIFRRL